MNPRGVLLQVLPVALLFGPQPARSAPTQQDSSPELAAAEAPRWEIAAAVSVYLLPDEEDLAIPVVYADRGPFHLEARYNYEARGSGSLFGGWTFERGDKLHFEATLMAGAVVGDLDGIAPGFELTLGYGPVEWYGEGEYVFDLEDSAGNFFYGWSELSYAPVEWFRVGLTTQRTTVVHTERDIQRGLHVGLSVRNLSFTAHAFNPDDEDPFYVLALAAEF